MTNFKNETYLSLANLCRGAKLFLKNNKEVEEVLFVRKHRSMLTVVGKNGLKNISYHQIQLDLTSNYYSDYHLNAG